MVKNLSTLLLLAQQVTLSLAACPNITLPWGIYQSSAQLNRDTVCVYKNVRFGKQPERFQKPQLPEKVTTSPSVQPTKAPACYQVVPDKSSSKGSVSVAEDASPPITGPLPGDEDEGVMSEDCLFADLYVPASALNAPFAKLPVVVWLYGGGFIFGSKDTGTTPQYDMPFYSGQGLLSHGQDFIFVAGNYRLGAFGW
jgi:carboxylesterase type B